MLHNIINYMSILIGIWKVMAKTIAKMTVILNVLIVNWVGVLKLNWFGIGNSQFVLERGFPATSK